MNGLNCKVGDLAIIVQDQADLENLGIIVKVEAKKGFLSWERYDHRQKKYTGEIVWLFSWRVTSLSGRIYYNDHQEVYIKSSGDFPDECLRPLCDFTETEQEVTEEESLVD
jgi:hypothetical protein